MRLAIRFLASLMVLKHRLELVQTTLLNAKFGKVSIVQGGGFNVLQFLYIVN